MALSALLSLTCMSAVLALSIGNISKVLAFNPPQPQGSQGFKLPLAVAPVQKQGTTPGTVENIVTVNVYDTQDLAYLLQISIGSQNFMLTLDTASSDLWVASSDCTDQDCQAIPTYRKTSTLALSTPFALRYVQGNVSGTVGYETVSLGQMEVYEQVFGMVTRVASIDMASMHNSGIFGLAFPKSSSIRRSLGKTLLENLYDALDENNRFFAFHVGRGGVSSSFTIGQFDSNLLSNTSLSYFPVYPADIHEATYDYWKLPLSRITLNGTSLSFSLSKSRVQGSSLPIATLDTGTSLILGPTRDVANFWSTVGGSMLDSESGLWMVRCDRTMAVGFVFGGTDGVDAREYFIDPRDLSWNGTQSGGWCLGGIQGNNKIMSSDWLLGDGFLRNVYATHHAATASTPPLIGLANLTDAASAMTAFHAERGIDPMGPISFHIQATRSPIPFLLLSAVAGFTSGLLVILTLKLGFCRRLCRKRFTF